MSLYISIFSVESAGKTVSKYARIYGIRFKINNAVLLKRDKWSDNTYHLNIYVWQHILLHEIKKGETGQSYIRNRTKNHYKGTSFLSYNKMRYLNNQLNERHHNQYFPIDTNVTKFFSALNPKFYKELH